MLCACPAVPILSVLGSGTREQGTTGEGNVLLNKSNIGSGGMAIRDTGRSDMLQSSRNVGSGTVDNSQVLLLSLWHNYGIIDAW